jgi:anti-sigma factor RsiW
MPDRHPGEQELQAFMRGELPKPDAAAIVRHLLTGCPECAVVTCRLWRLGVWPPNIRADMAQIAALIRDRRRHDEPGLI